MFGYRLGQVRLGQVRLGQVRLGQVRLGQIRLGQVRLLQRSSSLIDVQADCFPFFYEGCKEDGGCNFTSLQRVESGTLSIRLNHTDSFFLIYRMVPVLCATFHGSFYSTGKQLAIFPILLHVSFFPFLQKFLSLFPNFTYFGFTLWERDKYKSLLLLIIEQITTGFFDRYRTNLNPPTVKSFIFDQKVLFL